MPEVPSWLGLLGVHQDLLWFLVLLAWSFACLGWWRNPARDQAWAWLPWAAGMGMMAALLQFLAFNPPFDLFYERLVPGTNDTYTPALLNPDLFADMGMATVFAALAAAWWWQAAGSTVARALRWPVLVLCTGLVVMHRHHPLLAGTLLALLPFQALAYVWPKTSGHGGSRVALVLAVLLPLVSTVGPLADWAGKLPRHGPTGWFGAVYALSQLACASIAMVGLWREEARRLGASGRRALWHDARPFMLGGLVWLLAGTIFALRSGSDNAWEVKTNRLRTAASRAASFNLDLVTPLSNLTFDLIHRPRRTLPDGTVLAEVKELIPVVEPLNRELATVVRSTPFLKQARFVVLHEGWLVAVADNIPPGLPGTVQLLRHATAKDHEDWTRCQDVIEELPVPEERGPYYCRAAVVGPDHRMLGWLDFVRQEFYSSMDRKWRTGPLLVTALGAVLAAAFFVERRSSREREAALRAAAVAEETGRIKTAFLAKVSHELRTPLQSILGYSEILQQELTGARAVKQLAALRHHGQLMTRLVNDLIDLSALENGVFRLIEKPTPLAELVQQTVDSLRPRAEAKGLALHLRIDPELPAWIEADAERLRQIVLNLLGNAVKFTAQGRVEVGLRPSTTGATDEFELAVCDTGPGIPIADQPKLFQPFFRLELTAQQEGSGLGLALVAGLCRSMGGHVEIESAPGEGACFRVRLPLRPAVPDTDPSPVQLDQLLQGQKVLVADDNALVRELFTGYLRSLGAECIEACDGEEALNLARRQLCNAVVLDLAMPRLDGCAVARRLRASGSRVRIVGVSAHTDAADRAEALAAGMDDFLTKPVELTVLGQALATTHLTVPEGGAYERMRAQLAPRFRAELPAGIARITAALEACDWDELHAAVHHLKNSGLVMGDDRLSTACTVLERHIAARDEAAVVAAWSACTAALQSWTRQGTDGGAG